MPKKSGLTVDFTGVEAGGRSVADGKYRVKVKEVTLETGDTSGKDYLKWVYKIEPGQNHAGSLLYDNTSLQPQALWKLRGLLESMGVTVSGKFNLEPLRQWIGKETTVIVENEEYEGKQRPKISEYVVTVEADDDSEEEETEEETETEDEEEGEDETPAFKVGARVKFKEDGKTYKGKITEVNDDMATVQVGDDEWELDVSDLTPL